MGAELAEQRAEAKTAGAAYDLAVREAEAYYGHQEGYSGAINSKDRGFVLVALPSRFTYRKLQALLEDFDVAKQNLADAADHVLAYRPGGIWSGMRGAKGNLRKAEVSYRKAKREFAQVEKRVPASLAVNFENIVDTYHDKWGPPLAVQLTPAEAKPTKRGHRFYIFFGYAPS